MRDFANKAAELREKAERVDALESIYLCLEERMQWDTMTYVEGDEDTEPYYAEPEADSEDEWKQSLYRRYKVYREVLEMIEKLASK